MGFLGLWQASPLLDTYLTVKLDNIMYYDMMLSLHRPYSWLVELGFRLVRETKLVPVMALQHMTSPLIQGFSRPEVNGVGAP